ncbi:hypothetical protein Shyhy02_12370 [Streptomyces hygroscopicus subsp. hygroscopicus]|nr:hypothetical protein Shyhy02_12370 [Streptomyces hygroscopicus subsp. hygroscopicus]
MRHPRQSPAARRPRRAAPCPAARTGLPLTAVLAVPVPALPVLAVLAVRLRVAGAPDPWTGWVAGVPGPVPDDGPSGTTPCTLARRALTLPAP